MVQLNSSAVFFFADVLYKHIYASIFPRNWTLYVRYFTGLSAHFNVSVNAVSRQRSKSTSSALEMYVNSSALKAHFRF